MTSETRNTIVREGSPMYTLLKVVGVPTFKLLFRLHGEWLGDAPPRGPVILAANHSSYLDPLMLGATFPRPVRFMMLRHYWDKAFLGWVCRHAGSFPVDPEGSSHGAMKNALRVLRQGQVLGIFPEGGISPDGKLREAREGTALLALKTGTPVIPAAILGTHRAFPKGRVMPRPVKVTVRYGSLLQPPPPRPGQSFRHRARSYTGLIMDSVARLSGERNSLAQIPPAG